MCCWFFQESSDCYEVNDGSDETFETMGNDEGSGTGGQTCVGNGMLPETDGADSVDPVADSPSLSNE